jgi:AraC-like DNA-binding protein
VSLLLGGRCVVDQDGRRSLLRAGDFASWSSSRPYAVDAHSRHDLLVTYCEEVELRSRGRGIVQRTATAVPGDAGAARVVRRFLLALLAELEAGGPSESAPEVAAGLLALFGGLYDGALTPARSPGVLRMQIRAFVDEHLADPALGPEAIAAAHFISRRQLDRLFAGDDRTVAETIRARRLERCRAQLADPRHAGRSILDIALDHGFVSASHFSRSFRAAYGTTPREARAG